MIEYFLFKDMITKISVLPASARSIRDVVNIRAGIEGVYDVVTRLPSESKGGTDDQDATYATLALFLAQCSFPTPPPFLSLGGISRASQF